MKWSPVFTWPIVFATYAVIGALMWALSRRGRRKPAAPEPVARPVVHKITDVPETRAYGSGAYTVSPSADQEGGESSQ